MEAYKKGFVDALRAFAWWKDGVEFVGDGHCTLKQAIDEVEKNWNWNPTSDPLPDSIQQALNSGDGTYRA